MADRFKEALEGMVWQYAAYVVHNGKPALSTGGMSDLENAFSALGWDDPHYLNASERAARVCEVEGCNNEGSCGQRWGNDGPYLRVCSLHTRAIWDGRPMPKIRPHALARESLRDERGYLTDAAYAAERTALENQP